MNVVGYTDRLSVRTGEKLKVMVSCKEPSYEVTIGRLGHRGHTGGDRPQAGLGFEPMETSANSTYAGREQAIRTGSYVCVGDTPALRLAEGFTLQAWILPTTPLKGPQGLLTKWCTARPGGYGLVLDEKGDLALWLEDRSGRVARLRTGRFLQSREWYFVAATYDRRSGKVVISQQAVAGSPFDASSAVVTSEAGELEGVGETDVPFLIAAYWTDQPAANRTVTGHFNGKIDRPRVFSRPLDESELDMLRRGGDPDQLRGCLVAAWDFARDISSSKAVDASRNQLHGTVVNLPTRGVTGYNWTGNEHCFRIAPDEYGAIHFHDDDLEDAHWDVSFDFVIPSAFSSGLYAVRLVAGGTEDCVPFFVRPSRPAAPILFLAPTLTYLAYGNAAYMKDFWAQELDRDFLEPHFEAEDLYISACGLICSYDIHSDGSGNCYSSRLRPLLTMRPNYKVPLLPAGVHLAADALILDWLEAKTFPFDVSTDEDLHSEGVSGLTPYQVVVTGSHPEYWTGPMLAALQDYLENGGRLMYLGGNGFYWVTSIDPERLHIMEVRRGHCGTTTWRASAGENYHSTTGELGGLWRHRGTPSQEVVGVGTAAVGTDRAQGYRRTDASRKSRAAFIFDGLRDGEIIGDFGSIMGGAAGLEIDRAGRKLGTPRHALVVAKATGFSDDYQVMTEDILFCSPKHGGTTSPLVRADMTYFETTNGGAVFSVGSMTWCGSLAYNEYDNNVSRVTENVLRRFMGEATDETRNETG